MVDEKERDSFLAFDVQAFLKKVRAEQLHHMQGVKFSKEVWERYEFMIAAVEAEHLVSVVPKEKYDALKKETEQQKGECCFA